MEFPAEAVLRQLHTVDAASAEMTQARAAAGEVTMGSQAYGQLCQFLPAMLSPVFAGATEVLNEAADALTESALNLRRTASDMTATDAGNAQNLNAAAGPPLPL